LNNSSSGLWLKQKNKDSEAIIHALRSSQSEGKAEIFDVIIFIYKDGKFATRIDADKAELNSGYWFLQKAILSFPNKNSEKTEGYKLKTTLTANQIQASFSPPESISFFKLPEFIENLEATGFPSVKHRIYWHSLLVSPLLLCAMVLIAASFSLRFSNRRGKAGGLIAFSILSGFLIYFLSNIVTAFGMSGAIPIQMATWSVPTISTLIGITALLHLEE